VAADLLPEFTISTKVGFFPGDDRRTVHQLTPEQLRSAIKQTVDDLGTAPAVMLLHNPEASLAGLSAESTCDQLSAACAVLAEAKTAGLCGEWGISSWHPGPVLAALADVPSAAVPQPDVVMVRTGFLVPAATLDQADQLFEVMNVPLTGRWGMSPYGGHATDSIWDEIDMRTMLEERPSCSQYQAAFRLAYELPAVQRVAVGTNNLEHLRALVAAATFRVDHATMSSYRTLLRANAQAKAATEIG
jgi:aryl-alcohol dehydrogenase-like predicted oxidoreductase